MRIFLIALLFPFLTFADITPASVIQSVNEQRVQNGLPALTENATLTQIALLRAYDTARTHDWTHTPSDGLDYITLARFEGYRWTYIGENMANGVTVSIYTSSLMAAWMRSPEHRTNILGNYTETGVAIYGGYVVEEFGSLTN